MGEIATGYALRDFPHANNISIKEVKEPEKPYTYPHPPLTRAVSIPGSILGRQRGSIRLRRGQSVHRQRVARVQISVYAIHRVLVDAS